MTNARLGAVVGDTLPDHVLGQFDLSHDVANLMDGHGFNHPVAMTIDRSANPPHVYVTDSFNDRVLGWANLSEFTTGHPAEIVIGQPNIIGDACKTDCLGLSGIAADGAGNLYVADSIRNRVLEYDSPFNSGFTAGQQPHLEFGTDSAYSLSAPYGLAVDANSNLYIADSGHNRVLEYNSPLMQTGALGSGDTIPDFVFGQQDNLTGTRCNGGPNSPNPDATSLCGPVGVFADPAGNLWIADGSTSWADGNRVLEYNRPLQTDRTADLVLGAPDFYTPPNGSYPNVGASTFYFPAGPANMTLDSAGNLYVADRSDNRVLAFSPPFSNGQAANAVFGQHGSFYLIYPDNGGTSLLSLSYPTDVTIDWQDNLYVVDSHNNRVLEFNTPLASTLTPGSGDQAADAVAGQHSMTSGRTNYTDARGLAEYSFFDVLLGFSFAGASVAIDPSATPNRIYVTDAENNRILGYANAESFQNGAPADIVIGQPDFFSSDFRGSLCGPVTATSLCLPSGIGVDHAGNLWVADTFNNRVLEYNQPFARAAKAGIAADFVLGQNGRFGSNVCADGYAGDPAPSAEGLCAPVAVALDSAGNVYVADGGNNRVLEFDDPITTDAIADRVFGQSGNFSAGACNHGAATSADTLCFAFDIFLGGGVAFDKEDNLWIADSLNGRVLVFKTPLKLTKVAGSGDTTPDVVFGTCGSFTTQNCPAVGHPTADTLSTPTSVVIDDAGNVFIADLSNNRVLGFHQPLVSDPPDTTATRVLGQPALDADPVPNTPSLEEGMAGPSSVALDRLGDLFVADYGNNRVLEYDQVFAPIPPTPTRTATGTPTATPTATPTSTSTPTRTPTATATPNGAKISAPSSLTFKAVGIGLDVVSSAQLVIKNSGTGGDLIGNISPPSKPAVFAVSPGNFVIPRGKTSTIKLTCRPTDVTNNDSIAIWSNAANTPMLNVMLKCSGLPGTLAIPKPLTITSPGIGKTGSANLMLKNIGNGLLTGTTMPAQPDPPFHGGSYSLTLAPGATSTIAITFTSQNYNAVTGSIQLIATPPSTGSATVTLKGVVASSPKLNLSKTSMNFGSASFGNGGGQTSKPQLLTITNSSAAASVSFAEISTGSADFAIQSNTCEAGLAPKLKCSISLTFTPSRVGAASDQLTLVHDAFGSPQTVKLTGTGIAPKLQIKPTSISLRSPADDCSVPREFDLTNIDRNVGIAIESVDLPDTDSSDFFINDDECSGTALAPAESCAVVIEFCPSFTGGQHAVAEIIDDAAGSPQHVKLSGLGTRPIEPAEKRNREFRHRVQ